jgi:hypothetical protein
LINNVAVTPANAADRDALDDLVAEPDTSSGSDDGDDGGRPAPGTAFGDSAYADGATLDKLAGAGHEVFAKVPPVGNVKGYSKDEFVIDPTLPGAAAAGWPTSHSGAQAARCARPARPHDPGG